MLTDFYKPFLIERRVGGDFTDDEYITVGTYHGFIQPVSGTETFRDGKAGEQVTARLYTGLTTPGIYGYKVTQDGQSYIMLYTIQPVGISAVSHHKEILLGDFK